MCIRDRTETERDRERDRDRETHRETQRDRDRQTETEIERETDRQRQRQTGRQAETDRQTERDRDRETETVAEREKDGGWGGEWGGITTMWYTNTHRPAVCVSTPSSNTVRLVENLLIQQTNYCSSPRERRMVNRCERVASLSLIAHKT